MPDPTTEGQDLIDLDDQVPQPVKLPADESWVDIINDAKGVFEVDGAAAVFSSWRVEKEDPLNIGDIDFADGIHTRAGRPALDARMTDERAAGLLAALPEGEFLLRLKFLREPDDGDWIEDKLDPVRAERKKGHGAIEFSRETKPGALAGSTKYSFRMPTLSPRSSMDCIF
ncbi:MAG: hypothetical protein AB2693_30505 [Candidatus Thiodiazotropha sp.]